VLEHLHRLFLSRQAQHYALGLLVCMLLFLLGQTYAMAYREQGYDFTSYLLSAQALIQGENPYTVSTPFAYIYPLLLAFLLIPLSLIPYWLANFLWFSLSVGSLIWAFLVLAHMSGKPFNIVPGVILFVLMFSPIQNNLRNGQVNFLVLACCVMFLRSMTTDSRLSSIAWLGTAIALKLLPATLFLFLFIRKEYSVIGGTLVFIALLALLPGILVGSDVLTFYKSYAHSFLLPRIADSPAQHGLIFNIDRTVGYFSQSLGASPWMRLCSLLVALGAVLSVEACVASSERCDRDIWAFCAYLIACLLISPISETHHLTFIFPAVIILTLKIFFHKHFATKRVVVLFTSFLVCFVMLAKAFQDTPCYFVSFVILLVLVGLAGRQTQAD
jgi:hypothetical protein